MVTIRIGDEEEQLTWEQFEQRVSDGRIPEYAMVRIEAITGDDFVQAKELDAYTSLLRDDHRAWEDAYRSGAPPWMIALLAGIQIRIWWFTLTGIWPDSMDKLALYNPSVFELGEFWRMLTAGVMHMEFFHIASNLVMMVYVGWHLERALGRINLATIFVGSVVGGSVLSVLMTPQSPSIGSSGGVLGLVAATTVFGFMRYGLLSPRNQAIFGWALAPYLVLIYVLGWTGENTDNWAHTGGLVTGALLALVLDPPQLQRRARWNAMALTSVWAGLAAVLVAAFVAGPYIVNTADVEDHPTTAKELRSIQQASTNHRELEWTAPETWSRGSHMGQTGHVSRSGGIRSWSVNTMQRPQPAVLSDEVTRWIDGLNEDWEDQLTIEPQEPTSLDGKQAVRVVARIDNQDQSVVDAIITTRGTSVLTAVWIVPADLRARLAPVHASVIADVHWFEPASLDRARVASQRAPKNRTLRRRLADEFLANGEVEQAVAIYRELAEDDAGVAASWIGLLKVARWYPDVIADNDATLDKALATGELPEVIAEVALALHANDRQAEAAGILEMAWSRLPGDRYIRRARKSVGMPTKLYGTRPAHLYYDRLTGAVLDEPTAPDPSSLSIAHGASEGERLLGPRRALERRAMSASGVAALGPLLLLKRGVLDDVTNVQGQLAGVVQDLRTLQAGRDVAWASTAVTEWARQKPEAWITELSKAGELQDDSVSSDQALRDLGLVLQEDANGPTFRLTATSAAP